MSILRLFLVFMLVLVSFSTALSQNMLDVITTKAGAVYKGKIIRRDRGEGYMLKTIQSEFVYVLEADIESITQEESSIVVSHDVQQPKEIRLKRTIDSVGLPTILFGGGVLGSIGYDRMIYFGQTSYLGGVVPDFNLLVGIDAFIGLRLGGSSYINAYGRLSTGVGTGSGEFEYMGSPIYTYNVEVGPNVDLNLQAAGVGFQFEAGGNVISSTVFHVWQNEIASENYGGVYKGSTRNLTGVGFMGTVTFPLASYLGLRAGGEFFYIKDGFSFKATAAIEASNLLNILNSI